MGWNLIAWHRMGLHGVGGDLIRSRPRLLPLGIAARSRPLSLPLGTAAPPTSIAAGATVVLLIVACAAAVVGTVLLLRVGWDRIRVDWIGWVRCSVARQGRVVVVSPAGGFLLA